VPCESAVGWSDDTVQASFSPAETDVEVRQLECPMTLARISLLIFFCYFLNCTYWTGIKELHIGHYPIQVSAIRATLQPARITEKKQKMAKNLFTK
jgi:hypothetical protein